MYLLWLLFADILYWLILINLLYLTVERSWVGIVSRRLHLVFGTVYLGSQN